MRELIDGQTIEFDTHAAGNRQQVGIEGLHMHKRMNGKKYRGVHVIIPLDNLENISFRPPSTKDLIKAQIMKEIKRAIYKDVEKRKELVETITEEIGRYSNGLPNKERIQVIKRGAERIAKIFSKDAKIENEIKQHIDDKLKFFITSHNDESNKQFFVKQDFYRNKITLSDDIEELNKPSF